MVTLRINTIVLGFLLVIFAEGARAVLDDSVLLTAKSEIGDVCMVTDVREAILDETMSVKGSQDEKSKSDHRATQEYKREVMAVDPAGFPSQVKEFFTHNWIIDPSNKADMPHHKDLEGKSVRITRTKDGADVSISSGLLMPSDSEELQFEVAAPMHAIFPDHAIAVGQSWTPDPSLFGGSSSMKTSSISATLVDIVQYGGRRCAHFKGSFDTQEPLGSQSKSHTVLSGEGYYAMDIQRMVSLKVSGTVQSLRVEKLDAGPTTFLTKGTVSFSCAWDWKQIAGKPVTPAAN